MGRFWILSSPQKIEANRRIVKLRVSSDYIHTYPTSLRESSFGLIDWEGWPQVAVASRIRAEDGEHPYQIKDFFFFFSLEKIKGVGEGFL